MRPEAFYDQLFEAVTLRGDRAVVRMTSTYTAAGGPGSKVFPPTFPPRRYPAQDVEDGKQDQASGGSQRSGDRRRPEERELSPYVLEHRFVDGQPRLNVLLDGVASQANRAEEALLRARRAGEVELPLLELHYQGKALLTSLEFPHRYADAYLRDSLVDGTRFDRTELGTAFQAASLDDATALYAHDPGSLVFGAWNSQRKGRQRKFPRVYASELVGWDPVIGARQAGRMDPNNLTGTRRGEGCGDWEFIPPGSKAKGDKLSAIGHGNIAPNPAHGGVTMSSATRVATVSLAALSRIGFGSAGRDAESAARAVLAAYALLADRLAFGTPSLWLRSGCELVLVEERLEWIGRGGAGEGFDLPVDLALDVFRVSLSRAAAAGLPMSAETVRLSPTPGLAKAIDFALTKATASEE